MTEFHSLAYKVDRRRSIKYNKIGGIIFIKNILFSNLKVFKMNAACSTCLGSFTSISNISTTPCGHVFHTDCIEKWLQNGSNSCSQCRKNIDEKQITKLYFSESQSENNLITELEEAKNEAEKRSLNFQRENLELREEKWKLTQHKTWFFVIFFMVCALLVLFFKSF